MRALYGIFSTHGNETLFIIYCSFLFTFKINPQRSCQNNTQSLHFVTCAFSCSRHIQGGANGGLQSEFILVIVFIVLFLI